MLKILIIDDDLLTRKGIQSLMPWSKHNMEIVGEASNGKMALEFLKDHVVDLALVDIDMPIMDGITFIQKAKESYPLLNYVVLTVHTEFEYIQKVLRIGAIDYIAKTQFDQENFDLILERINTSIMQKNAPSRNNRMTSLRNRKILYPDIYALVTIDSENEEQISNFWELNHLSDNQTICEIIAGVWFFYDVSDDFIFPELFTNTTLLHISDVRDMDYVLLGKLLRNYKTEQFFYDYQPIKKINYKRAYELQEEKYVKDEASFEKLKKEWISLNWVYKNDLFDKIRIDLKNSKLKFSQLYHLLLTLENVWNTSYSELTGQTVQLPSSFKHWKDVENWLCQLYEKTNIVNSSNNYSSEVIQNILGAKNYLDTHYNNPVNTTEIARNFHMSYGYFSRCFHDIIGMSVSDYCINVRMKAAKDLLNRTSKTFQQISFDVGYSDEKYFSRLFKKIVGCSPSDYRK